MKRLAVVAATLLMPAAASAAPVVHTYTGEVRACLPLDGGGALVGTGGGLLRVDERGGVKQTWTARDGLPGTRIESLVRDGDTVWVGADGGAAQIAVAGGLSVKRTVAGRPVRDLVEHKGALYLAVAGDGVKKLGARAAIPFKSGGAQARQVNALAAQGGALYAGTAAGLFVLRGARFEAIKLEAARPRAPEPVINGLAADGPRLWIATHDGLFVRDADGVRFLGGGELADVAVAGDEVLTAGRGDGLQRVERGRRLAAPDGAPRDLRIAQAVNAWNGAVCTGGLDGLWLRAAPDAPWLGARTFGPRAGLPANDISALAVDGERRWVGTFDQGLVIREKDAWSKVGFISDVDPRINALLVEPRPGRPARVWVATAAGLMYVEDSKSLPGATRLTRRDGLPGRGVMSLLRLRDGRIIAGTSAGAAIIDETSVPVPVGPPGDDVGNVWAMAEDADGMLWLGTTTGVWRGPSTPAPKGGDRRAGWTRMSVATGHLVDDWIMAITTRGRQVWVGGYKGGVVRFDLADLSKTTPLGGGWVNPGGLAWDGAELLVSTQEGLRRGDGVSATWRTDTGLPGKDVTAVARVGTTLWIASRRGLTELRP